MSLTEQECIEVAERVWGLAFHEFLDAWVKAGGELRDARYRSELPNTVNSYEGLGRTLEAMRAKGWRACMVERSKYAATDFQWHVSFDSPDERREATGPDLPTAVHRAALAALGAVGQPANAGA